MPTVEQQQAAAIQWMHERQGRFRYSNARPAKLKPDQSGESDCSGTIYAALTSLGVQLADIDMSYELASNGQHIASGATVAEFRQIAHLLLPGDVVAMALRAGYGSGAAINHVEMSAGPGTSSWGHGGPGYGPTANDLINNRWLLPNAAWWTVRRYILPTTHTIQTETTEEEEPMFIIKSPNRPHALIAPGYYRKFRNSEELAAVNGILKPVVKDAINDRQYDLLKSIMK